MSEEQLLGLLVVAGVNDSIIYLTQAGFDALRTEALPELIKRDRHKDWRLVTIRD